ncbi:hypothetical protein QYF61_017337 [Mycteria americana]|uniref:Uncharacterized protein n=1 Tax=Mycteria americana TaxID=33587 RepID=A0AAN7RZI3_MYCAM|nr:hypothetical protein QYF61_017337 [Mycteria americana]
MQPEFYPAQSTPVQAMSSQENAVRNECPDFLNSSALQDCLPRDSVNEPPKQAKVYPPEVSGGSSADPPPYFSENQKLYHFMIAVPKTVSNHRLAYKSFSVHKQVQQGTFPNKKVFLIWNLPSKLEYSPCCNCRRDNQYDFKLCFMQSFRKLAIKHHTAARSHPRPSLISPVGERIGRAKNHVLGKLLYLILTAKNTLEVLNCLAYSSDTRHTKAFHADLRDGQQPASLSSQRAPSEQALATAYPRARTPRDHRGHPQLLHRPLTAATAQAKGYRRSTALPPAPFSSPRQPSAARCHHLPPAAASEVEAYGTAPPADGAVLRRRVGGRGRRVAAKSRLRQHGGESVLLVASSREWLLLGTGSPGRGERRGSGCLPGRAPDGETPLGLSLGADCIGAHQYPKKANDSHSLIVNSLGESLGLFQTVANSVEVMSSEAPAKPDISPSEIIKLLDN